MATDTKRSTIITILKDFLAKQGDVSQLKAMSEDLKSLISQEAKQHTAIITTASELSSQDKMNIESEIKKITQDLAFDFQVDPRVLGGLRVQIQDEIIDLTVTQALEQLKNRLKQ